MAALITSDFDIPAEISAGIFKKAQSGSTLAQLSGARPQKFGKQQAWVLTAAPKAELVGEAASKSPTPATYAPKVINPMNIYGAEGQDINELAQIISEKLNAAVTRKTAVFA